MNDRVESELLAELRRGSSAAFARVYAREKGTVFGFLLRLSRDRDVAADLFQNTWLKLARHAHTLRDDTDLRAWLLTVARNEYRSFCRARLLDLSRLLAWRSEAQDSVPEAALGTGIEHVEVALARLSAQDREVLLLTASEGVSSAQAAQVLDVSDVALRQRLARARKRLAAELAKRERWAPLATRAK